MKDRTQVLVVGGGPAGATVATLLARGGVEVTLAEREVFPRYHIGESLLPSCIKILDLMGMRDKLREFGFQRKEGVYFEWGGPSWEARFLNLEGIDDKHSYQVSRAEFDQLLLEHAKSQGVAVHEGTAVKRVEFDGDRPVQAVCMQDGEERTIGFDLLVDATGRAGLMANRHQRDRVFHQAFRNVAVWGYWRGSGVLPTDLVGATGVCAVPDGWFWAIPLRDGTVSLGLVLHRDTFQAARGDSDDLRAFYLNAIAACPTIRDLVRDGALVSDLRVEQDYSYASDRFAGPGYFISGDAACFLDPLLSTGVHLAQYSAVLAAASICSVLRGEVSEQEARDFYHASYRQAYLRFFTLVSCYYQQYGGQRTYFWEAQQLTARDYHDTELNQAFLNIITGIEDFKDAAASEYVLGEMNQAHKEAFRVLRDPQKIAGLDPAEQERAKAKFELLDRTAHRFSLTEEAAVHGLYAVLEPQLGLARAVAAPLIAGRANGRLP